MKLSRPTARSPRSAARAFAAGLAALIVAGSLATQAPTHADDPLVTASGTVFVSEISTKKLADVTVTAVRHGSTDVAGTAVTDQDGRYVISLPAGTYAFTFDPADPKYATVTEDWMFVDADDPELGYSYMELVAPTMVKAPRLINQPNVGSVLAITPGTWSSPYRKHFFYGYSWSASAHPKDDFYPDNYYVVGPDDLGKTLQVHVDAGNEDMVYARWDSKVLTVGRGQPEFNLYTRKVKVIDGQGRLALGAFLRIPRNCRPVGGGDSACAELAPAVVPTGVVSVLEHGATLGAASLRTTGYSSYVRTKLTGLAQGTHHLTLSYPGSDLFEPATLDLRVKVPRS